MDEFLKKYSESLLKKNRKKTIGYLLGIATFCLYEYINVRRKYFLINGEVRLLKQEEILPYFISETYKTVLILIIFGLVFNIYLTIKTIKNK